MGFPSHGEPLDGEFKHAGRLGKGQPDVVVAAAVEAAGAACRDGNAAAGGDVSEGVGAIEGEFGRRLAFADGRVDAAGKPVAKANAVFAVL